MSEISGNSSITPSGTLTEVRCCWSLGQAVLGVVLEYEETGQSLWPDGMNKVLAQFPEIKGKVTYGDDFFQYQGPQVFRE